MFWITFSLMLLVFVPGCLEKPAEFKNRTDLSNDFVQQYRQQFLIAAEPAGSKSVIEVRDALMELETDEQTASAVTEDVVVVGVIGGMPNPYGDEGSPEFPWYPNLAAFSLADPSTTAQFEGHQHEEGEECIFCNRTAQKLVDTVASVRLRDDQGQVIEARADDLLLLPEGSVVVVKGTGSIELERLVIDAEQIFVRPNVDDFEADPTVR